MRINELFTKNKIPTFSSNYTIVGKNIIEESFETIAMVKAGYYFTAILKSDGTVWTCGDNGYGQLGLGDNTERHTFTQTSLNKITQIATGLKHIIAMKENGDVYATGQNNNGQLGLGDTNNRHSFTLVPNIKAKKILAGGYSSGIITNDNKLYLCGHNEDYHVVPGSGITNITTFAQVMTNIKDAYIGRSSTFVIKNDDTIWCLGSRITNTTYSQWHQLNYTNIKKFACGNYFNFMLKNDGTLWATGTNISGELGLGDTNDRTNFTQVSINNVTDVSAGYGCASIIKNNNVYCSGSSNSGVKSNANRLFNLANNTQNSISTSTCSETIILRNDKKVLTGGLNNYGQLGLGYTSTRNTYFSIVPGITV